VAAREERLDPRHRSPSRATVNPPGGRGKGGGEGRGGEGEGEEEEN
jgi:hypothetical protein